MMDSSEVTARMRKILSEKLNVPVERIVPEASLRDDLGMDSFASVEILFEIEEAFNVNVPQDDVSGIKTFGDMMAFVEKITAKEGQGIAPGALKGNDGA
jgi:acyl carrier protein